MAAVVALWSDRHYIGWEKRANEAKRILRVELSYDCRIVCQE